MGSFQIRSAGVAATKTKRTGGDFESFLAYVDHREGVREAWPVGDSGVEGVRGLWLEQLRVSRIE